MEQIIRVLFIEDSKIDQRIFKSFAEKNALPYECTIVSSVAAAGEVLFHKKRFDVAITDFFLEDGTALEVLAFLADIPAIVVTGAEDHETAVRAMKAGAYDYLIKDPQGEYLKLLPVSVENALKRKKAEEQSRMLSHAVMNISDCVFITDLDNRIFFINDALRSLFHYSGSDLNGKPSTSLFLNCDVCAVPLNQPLKDERVSCIRKDGSVFPALISRSHIIDEYQKVSAVVWVVRDLTAIHAAEREKERLEGQLRQAQKLEAVGQLAGGIAHDFNNILGSIIGYSELTLEDLPQGKLAYKNIGEVLKAANRAKQLVEQILVFSRSTSHEFEPINVSEIIDEVIALLEPKLTAGLRFEKVYKVGVGTVYADAGKIHQAVLNLATNAMHAMKGLNGGIVFSVDVEKHDRSIVGTHQTLPPGKYCRIAVADSGCGIPADDLGRIFDPFFTTKAVGEGTGLGLSILHGVVSDHGGAVRVDTKAGKGTRFEIYLPIYEKVNETVVTGESQLVRGNGRILIVEDEEGLGELGRAMLKRLGYEVRVERDGFAALEAVRADPDSFDLIITDQNMPNLTGDALAKRILDINPNIPLVACTGYSKTLNNENAAGLGFRAFLKKPVGLKQLGQVVNSILRNQDN